MTQDRFQSTTTIPLGVPTLPPHTAHRASQGLNPQRHKGALTVHPITNWSTPQGCASFHNAQHAISIEKIRNCHLRKYLDLYLQPGKHDAYHLETSTRAVKTTQYI